MAADHPVTDPSRFDVLDVNTAVLAGVDAGSTPTDPGGAGALGERLWDGRAPLTPKRFVGNLVDAVRPDRFRFPADPEAARRRLCGGPSG
ncbi:MAG TPA: hypothetical protein VKB57_07955 [Acidimicrobiales bacterium]|nr:hypothetical protein [Acidimicrobiales bacterium]